MRETKNVHKDQFRKNPGRTGLIVNGETPISSFPLTVQSRVPDRSTSIAGVRKSGSRLRTLPHKTENAKTNICLL